jgi:dynactin complex subunit
MKTILILLCALLLQGCLYFNDRGVSGRYYNGCKEYYDSMGVYHKDCDENILEYKTVTDGVKKGVEATVDTTKSLFE